MIRFSNDDSTAPSVDDVDTWLTNDLGMRSEKVGSSYQNRDIVMYEYDWSPEGEGNDNSYSAATDDVDVPVILFISLVHGNEGMGLLALLQTVKIITHQDALPPEPMRILFLPFVNIDAYTLNRQVDGCRRTNLRPTCNSYDPDDEGGGELEDITSCIIQDGGVDLNRNHPMDWDHPTGLSDPEQIKHWQEFSDCSYECGTEYHGPEPWSEPETRAVRDVVLNNNISVALSFHSRHRMDQSPLLIHPYTADRDFSGMPVGDQKRFRSWSKELNRDNFYVTGTADEAIHYTAGGSTIDWMYSVGIISFVVEVVPPCNDRWCSFLPSEEVWGAIAKYGNTGYQLIQLLYNDDGLRSSSRQINNGSYLNTIAVIGAVGTISGMLLLCWYLRRSRKRSQEYMEPVPDDTDMDQGEVEMENLT
ncbi:hypothetical protein ACHAXR_005691 [Thalassiosira sp. AJA248-18]